jgi:hypothetical protein
MPATAEVSTAAETPTATAEVSTATAEMPAATAVAATTTAAMPATATVLGQRSSNPPEGGYTSHQHQIKRQGCCSSFH